MADEKEKIFTVRFECTVWCEEDLPTARADALVFHVLAPNGSDAVTKLSNIFNKLIEIADSK